MAKKTKTEPKFEVSSPTILETLFTPENVRRTIARMRAWQDAPNEVTHPLLDMILLEYEDSLAAGIAASVSSGSWSPSPSYVVLAAKRSGTYRELAYPSVLDTIVGRRVIDALEPHITADDNERVFCGRTHANADRARGDYENWFKVWLDFTSEIGEALEDDGYTYVFDTDVTQFFPTVDRPRAKAALAQRTRAHQTLLELLFYCLETWAPRVRFNPVPGLPIEPNDVSRLVAHNFIKGVDEHFVNDPKIEYLRWVDDTVIFVKNERDAHDAKRRHHLALREMGLSPNASKTSILSAAEYGESRHPEFNRRIDEAAKSESAAGVRKLVQEWEAKDREKTPNWDKVATRLYSTARQVRSSALREFAVEHMESCPGLVRAALKYLHIFPVDEELLRSLLAFYGRFTTSVEARIEVARFLCDARLSCEVRPLIDAAVGNVLEDDERLGSGYARGLFLLCLNKYGGKAERDKVRGALSLDHLQDDQLRLHYLYVFSCRGELDDTLARAMRHLSTPDILLLERLCEDVKEGRHNKHAECLKKCISSRGGRRTIAARHLPFLHALLASPERKGDSKDWLEKMTTSPEFDKFDDETIRRFLTDELTLATR